MRQVQVAAVVILLLLMGAATVVWGGGFNSVGRVQMVGLGEPPEPGGEEVDLARHGAPGVQSDGGEGDGVGSATWSEFRAIETTAIQEESGIRGPTGPPGESPSPEPTLPEAIDLVPGYEPMQVRSVEPLLPERSRDLPPLWEGLDDEVYAVAASFPGRLSVVAVDLTTGSRYEFRARDPYLPASTFKLPVTLCTLEAISRGELAWDTQVTYTEEDDEPVGAGGFATAPFGSQYTVRNLVDRSLISSNNVAVKMLARTLTWDGLLACTTQMGGPVTRTVDGSTPVTAADEAAWWLHLYKLYQQQPALAEELLRPLRQVTYWGRIQSGTPQPHLVTHKFGTYAGHDHDGAIIWAERPYLLVVMTYGAGEFAADQAIERIAGATWQAVMGQAGF